MAKTGTAKATKKTVKKAKAGAKGPALTIRVRNAARRPLHDEVDIEVRQQQQPRSLKARWERERGTKTFVARKLLKQPYTIRVTPLRHRRVQLFTQVTGPQSELHVHCPIDPKYAIPKFSSYTALPPELRRVLDNSTVTGHDDETGGALYDALAPRQKAGLLNLYAKMSETAISNSTAWAYVDDIYRIQGDRIFANVQGPFRDLVEAARAEGDFKDAGGLLHKPPPGFHGAGSFKSRDSYGNLQLTFFVSEDGRERFRVDADIDNAAGFEHAFQVLEHWATGEDTDPYDIHQILLLHQQTVHPLYVLNV